MAGGHAEYVAPKTDGTFGVKVNWSQLSSNKVAPVHDPTAMPVQFKKVATAQDFEKRTLSEWWNYRSWTSQGESPYQALNPVAQFRNYRHRYFNQKVPPRQVFIHWFMAVGALGFVVHYGKNSVHTYAKHH